MGCCANPSQNRQNKYKQKPQSVQPTKVQNKETKEEQIKNKQSRLDEGKQKKAQENSKAQPLQSENKPQTTNNNTINTQSSTLQFNGKDLISIMPGDSLKQGEYSIGKLIFSMSQNSLLGKGGCASVYRGKIINEKQPEVAIKVLDLEKGNSEKKLKKCRQETLRQRLLKSDGIVKIYDSKYIPLQNKKMFVIASELMEGGELKVPENGFPVEKALYFLKEVLRCYGALYTRGIIHRDIKPQNILLTKDGKLKLSDFGSTKEKFGEKQDSTPLTPGYGSPQQAKNQEHTDKCDVYAIACMFFQFLIGATPRNARCIKSFNKMDMKKLNKKLNDKKIPQQIQDFLQGCLRQKQFVQTLWWQKEDAEKARFGWQDVYLHPIFKGELIDIPRKLAGNNMLLTIRASAQSNDIDIIQVLLQQRQIGDFITQEEFSSLLRNKNVQFTSFEVDLQMLAKMYGKDNKIQIKQIIRDILELDNQQFSNYAAEETYQFLQLTYCEDQQGLKYRKFLMDACKTGEYQSIVEFHLKNIEFVAFPLLPKMQYLQKLQINGSSIQVLQAHLNTPNLKYLTITYSYIQKIITIRGCPNLIRLKLDDNKIRKMEGFQLLKNLQYLSIQNNRLQKIGNISHLKRLQDLSLRHNLINKIEGMVGCTSLRGVGLSDNRIKQFGDFFWKTKQITIRFINLCNNLFERNYENEQCLQFLRKEYVGVQLNWYREPIPKGNLKYQIPQIKIEGYKILAFKDKKKCIGISQDQDNNLVMKLSLFFSHIDQVWMINALEGENNIMAYNGDFVGCFFDYCKLERSHDYEKRLQIQKSAKFLWKLEKKGVDSQGKAYYSIRNMESKQVLRYEHRQIMAHKQQDIVDQNNMWYVEPFTYDEKNQNEKRYY